MSADWKAAEPGVGDLVRELGRVYRRAARRWLVVAGLTLAVTAAIVGARMRKPKMYPARIVVTIAEGSLGANRHEMSRLQLQNEIRAVAFSPARLADVMKQHDLYPRQRDFNLMLALENMRDATTLEVFQDYAEGTALASAEGRRFARIALTFEADSPTKALDVARALGQLVFATEDSRQQDLFKSAMADAEATVQKTRDELDQLRQVLAVQQLTGRGSGGTADAVSEGLAAADVHNRLVAAGARATKAQRQLADLELRLSAQKAKAALRYVIADPGYLRQPVGKGELLARTGVVGFIGALLVSMLLVGAFDLRVYEAVDVQRTGLVALGRVPFWDEDTG